MKQEKTASEWFDMLIEPYCTQAKNYTSKGMLDVGYENFEDALSHSFTWEETEQGFFFWNNLEYSVGSGETTYLKPTDTTEYEKQLEEKFAPELLQPQFGNELINEIIAYIEEVEQKMENEWGYFRELSDLIEKKEMPDVYYKLVQMRELQK